MQQHYLTNPQVIHETIEGETIVIDLATGTYYSLQGVAPAIWNALSEGESAAGIVGRLEQMYGPDAVELEAVVAGFLQELERERLIAATSGNGDAPAAVAAPTGEPRSPFAPPKLEKYTDMQDIILLDPVHKVDDRGWPHAAPEVA